jgi:hypothetical protein
MAYDMNEVLSSKWMANTDLPEQGVDLQMLNVTKEAVGEMLEEKFALHFNGGFKPLLMNRTNIRIINSLYGPNTAGWIGKTVNVYNDPTVSYGGRVTGGVRVRMATANQQQRWQAPQQAPQPQATAQEYRQASGGQLPSNEPPAWAVEDIPF